jgi:hypothetical protein
MAAAACAGEPNEPAGEQHDMGSMSEESPDGVLRVDNPREGLWADASSVPLSFELEAVYGGDDAPFMSIAGAVVDRSGVVHVFDAAASELVALAPDGSLRHRVGSPGSGPQQFDGVRGIAYDGVDTIFVVNQQGTRLDAWGTDGTLQSSLSLADVGLESAYMGGVLSPRRIALLTNTVHNTAANEYIVIDLADPPSASAPFRLAAEPMVPIPPGVVLQLSHSFAENEILVGTWEQYVLRGYDSEGRLTRRVTRDVDYLRRPGFAIRDGQYLGVVFGGLAAPIVLADGYWLVMATWPTNVDSPNGYAETPTQQRAVIAWESSLDLFDPDGRFLYSLRYPGAQSPQIGRPWTVGSDGALYTVVADPFPQVRRYRVTIAPPAGNDR